MPRALGNLGPLGKGTSRGLDQTLTQDSREPSQTAAGQSWGSGGKVVLRSFREDAQCLQVPGREVLA